jgi:hypothetical protein
MTTKYTPGPWEHFAACEVTANDPAGESSHVLIAHTYESPNPKANARLIAAAPELADEARKFCARVEAGEIRSKRTYAAFKALLAKIDGEQA